MDTRKVFAGAIVLIIIAVIIFTWNSFPAAKYVELKRSDGLSNFIAIERIDIYDTNGRRVNIISMDQSKSLAAGAGWTLASGGNIGVNMDGKMLGYYEDSSLLPLGTRVGPCVGFVSGTNAGPSNDGSLVFTFEERANIAKIDIFAPNNDLARRNLERVKVTLWNADRAPIPKAEIIIPVSQSPNPPMVHHIRFT